MRAYGLFLVVGDGFRGFHLRMKDVSRGGLRMIMSRNAEGYSSAYTLSFRLNMADGADDPAGWPSQPARWNSQPGASISLLGCFETLH